MTIEQTVEIPASRRVTFDLPFAFPVGKAKVEVTVTPEYETTLEETPIIPLLELRGSCKGEDTIAAYLERKRADKTIEFEHDRRLSGQ
ncbi:hypothetical protein FACS189479_00870 [Spirochaetia bacterium]|nr:hypothetical protein FACS189479_00870 [Spirochaetia bacterium]